ncbi:AbrB/MazE/SpoVT family DNA-binding domain-containing protein [Robertmurraya yapensis]|uniref:AbrB/MazE/SpoVT family DNA-binding domain-containing protein n=1 Tax=Bacillus yapensis TaxID=2492960 RepID=A0A431VYI8_9BACI|nr:AbrB/MazE/SpoVT family DNA-binding domain-containing protein [Bacillus yapensis]RTR28156.1 AbrB/MazE/SpoVT family DNA-binding domain-containing protein [Bacillus yapensis]TKS94399.1 AbrB/MazE/SpoVT family DNA-binding domain-containing protein [Bacillus yapensis]
MIFYKKISKTGQINLPKEICTELNLIDGEYLFIYKHQNSIVIEKQHENVTFNQCIFRNGKVSIPVELRKLTDITQNTLLEVQNKKSNEKIIITPVKDKLLS